MMMRTDSSMLASYRLSWMPPFGPTEKGNLRPTPRKLLMRVPMPRLRGRDPHFHLALAGGAAHHPAALALLDLQPVGRVALGADEPPGAARAHPLDDLVPDGLGCRHPLFGILIHLRQGPRRSTHRSISSVTLQGQWIRSREADPYRAGPPPIKPGRPAGRQACPKPPNPKPQAADPHPHASPKPQAQNVTPKPEPEPGLTFWF